MSFSAHCFVAGLPSACIAVWGYFSPGSLVELHNIPVTWHSCSIAQSVEVPLNGITIWGMNHYSQYFFLSCPLIPEECLWANQSFYNHRLIHVGRDLRRSPVQSPAQRKASFKARLCFSGPCPSRIWKQPRIEIALPYGTCGWLCLSWNAHGKANVLISTTAKHHFSRGCKWLNS